MHSTHALVNKSTISLQGFNLRYALVSGDTWSMGTSSSWLSEKPKSVTVPRSNNGQSK